MRIYDKHGVWRQIQGKRRPHWAILTLDDLPRNNSKYTELIAQLQEQYQASKLKRDVRHRLRSKD